MGQRIEVKAIVFEDVAVFDTDRSITGQDGRGFARDSDFGDDFGSRLAAKLFDTDEALVHVFAASSQVVVRRPDGWDEASVARASGVIRDLFVFYD